MSSRNIIKNAILILISITMLLVIICGCSEKSLTSSVSTKEVINGNASFTAFSIEELAKQANTIVRGTVVSKGVAFEIKFGSDTVPATPITIKVTSWIKGDQDSETIIYNQLGGETEKHIMEPLFTPLSINDDIIICLLPDGLDYGPDAIFRIQDEMISVQDFQLPELESIKNGDKTARIKVNELISEFEKWMK